ncbi:O-methyltransferase [Couchioplanes caeruleus]|uniref:Protein-L-isoaspartate O-methyltransferase n=2 Tax=Couchioplanes caeruleus TaxID=56438 RepID=A0A1K0FLT9_9ACTN|nr:class I SAM-dependent methyltransferase [Couchioplanes caeruleus]OJF13696.1 protein-L-isoaspartate O-methyltransferase [Couchioplanes caeruleus subsp. caeruleus]ROP32492.1 putative O-methyltransferase YrrM [Couchioplanes caeruleus]
MSGLTRFGGRLAVRLQSLTRPQAVVLMVVLALVAGVWTAAASGHAGLATSLVAVLLLGVLLGILHLSRWMAGLYRANQAAHRDLRIVVEQMQRRVVAGVEKERLSAGDRHQELTRTLARGLRQHGHGNDLLLRAQSREIEAMFQLFAEFTPRAPMPSSGDFALNPTDLLDLLYLVRLRRPQLVVELGSGTSTVWLAYALEKTGGRLVSLDHDGDYARKTREQLDAHGLSAVAEVRTAPLTELAVDGKTYRWYDVEKLADVRDIDLLLIDGPPAATGPDARYPALHALQSRLAPVATVVLDDADRPDEQDAVRRWTENITGLTAEPRLLGRHAVLSYSRSGAPASVPA